MLKGFMAKKQYEKMYAYSTYFNSWIRAEKVGLFGWTFRLVSPNGTPVGPVFDSDTSIDLFIWYPSPLNRAKMGGNCNE